MLQAVVSESSGPQALQRFRHAILYLDAQRLQDMCQVTMSLAGSDSCTFESASLLQACSQNAVMAFTAQQGCHSVQPGAAWRLPAVAYKGKSCSAPSVTL